MPIQNEIWVLSDLGACTQYLEDAAGAGTSLRAFTQSRQIEKAMGLNSQSVRLLVVDQDEPDVSWIERLKDISIECPTFVIISHCNRAPIISSCLASGAWDYLLKPVDPNLLKVKIQWILKECEESKSSTRPRLTIDFKHLTVRNETGSEVALTMKEFRVLSVLYQHYPDGATRAEIHQEVWRNVRVISKALDVHLFRLRRKLEGLGFEIQFRRDEKFFLVKK